MLTELVSDDSTVYTSRPIAAVAASGELYAASESNSPIVRFAGSPSVLMMS